MVYVTSRAKKRKYTIWKGRDKRRWIAGKEQRNKMEKDELLIKNAKEEMKTDMPFIRNNIGQLIAKTAKSVMEFNPTAIVAIETRGVPAARLVQYYIQKKTGKKIKVYPIKIEGNRGSDRSFGPNAELVPIKTDAFIDLKKQSKIAIMDDVLFKGHTKDKMIDELGKSVGTKNKTFEFSEGGFLLE